MTKPPAMYLWQMMAFNNPGNVFVTCQRQLGPYLEREIKSLNFEILRSGNTGVLIQASLNDCILLNLKLRCASQVLYSLKKFKAHHPDDVYEEAGKIKWESIIENPGYFSVKSTVDHPTINNNLFVNLRIKDAINDRLRKIRGNRPDTGAELKGTVISLHWKNEEAELFLDTSGDSIARHGYRKFPGKAPMLEALAAATIYASGWSGQSSFINPMCGSGTLAIEAALISTNTAPGLFRMNFGFMHIMGYDEKEYYRIRNAVEEEILEENLPVIVATDISEAAIETARKNAKAAGVEKFISFRVCDFASTPVPQENKGVICFNPEYGERLGNTTELEATYKRMGDFMKQKCKGYKGYVFTGNPELAKKIGLKANKRMVFFNSKIECRLLEYELY